MSADQGRPSFDPDLFEDFEDAPVAPSQVAHHDPAGPAAEAESESVIALRHSPAQPADWAAESDAVFDQDADDDEAPHDAPDGPLPNVAEVAAVGGQLYRSAGATGALAALARPARVAPEPSAGRNAVASPQPSADPRAPVSPVHVVSVTGWGQPAVRDQTHNSGPVRIGGISQVEAEPVADGPDWLHPASGTRERSASRPGLLGRPAFGAISGDGLLLASDGVTLIGELVLVGAAAAFGALVDIVLGTGFLLPLLTLIAAWAGAFRIRSRELPMAFAVPPILYLGAGVVLGQLSLPAGRHVTTREALLLVNLLPGSFPWLVVIIAGTGAIAWLRSRRHGTQVAA